MNGSTKMALYTAMVLFSIVSIMTTYISLTDSILPEPTFDIPLGGGYVWQDCAVFALALSLAIGLMLFALKLAIIDGQKRLNVLGVIGLTIIAFISITFNMDVLYRTADQEFFLRYSDQKMRAVYENFLAEAQTKLTARREALQKVVAKQEGELEAEIRGLREKPAGYGPVARQEDYRLTLATKESEVELQSVEEAMTIKDEADLLLANTQAMSLEEIHGLQEKLRVPVAKLAGFAAMPVPPIVKQETPLFVVFEKLFDWRNIGPMEILVLFLAFLLDLGDIIGYSLVPNKTQRVTRPAWATFPEHLSGPEVVRKPSGSAAFLESPQNPQAAPEGLLTSALSTEEEGVPVARFSEERRRRPFRFRRR
ncbi:MAG: hypothetical protein IT364_04645 [Candidatus Hydrogenedentes bacterium]|nr:hypothetical protein [Candidatus Hydrogenedentota bacterium]